MELNRANVLRSIRRAPELAPNAKTSDLRLLLRAGVMPKTLLAELYPDANALEEIIDDLLEKGKIKSSLTYYIENPSDRIRPIATRYEYEKPARVSRHTKKPTTYRVQGRDRLALWYAAANKELDGSRGEAYGLKLLLEFWRLPGIQRAWKRYIGGRTDLSGHFRGKLPEDAK